MGASKRFKELPSRKQKPSWEMKLPWPISVNSMYKNAGGQRRAKTEKALAYEEEVYYMVKQAKLNPLGKGRLKVQVLCFPPDNRRRRDMDNLGKILFDSLQQAGVYEDDEQIDDLRWIRRPALKPGHVVVTIEVL